MLRIALLLISSALGALSCKQVHTPEALPYYNAADFTPLFLDEEAADTVVTHIIAPFSFHDQHNKRISNPDLQKKIHIANFFFCSCGSVCPGMMENLRMVSDAFQHDDCVEVLSFSVTPWRDSVSVLREYAIEHRITAANWHLLTGDRKAIYDLARRSYFAEEEIGLTKDSSNFLHTEHVFLVDEHGKLRGVYNGSLKFDMEQLIKDVHVLNHHTPFND